MRRFWTYSAGRCSFAIALLLGGCIAPPETEFNRLDDPPTEVQVNALSDVAVVLDTQAAVLRGTVVDTGRHCGDVNFDVSAEIASVSSKILGVPADNLIVLGQATRAQYESVADFPVIATITVIDSDLSLFCDKAGPLHDVSCKSAAGVRTVLFAAGSDLEEHFEECGAMVSSVPASQTCASGADAVKLTLSRLIASSLSDCRRKLIHWRKIVSLVDEQKPDDLSDE